MNIRRAFWFGAPASALVMCLFLGTAIGSDGSGSPGSAGAPGAAPSSPLPGGAADDESTSQPVGLFGGPDVVYSTVGSVAQYGPVGGIRAYALGSGTCNIGDQNLRWGFSWQGTPGLAMNAYRLHNGRLIQIGMGFVKHSCCAAAGTGCGMACNGQGGSWLGIGCKDTYSAGYNGGQGSLGPRSSINAFSGQFTGPPGGSGDAIFRRMQIAESDLLAANFPGALYFVEGVYVGSDDAETGNSLNNASYQRVTITPSFGMTLAESIHGMVPAIYAWRDHGNGVGQPDNSVLIQTIDIPNEGRFIGGSKAIDNGNGTWRYEYAVFNLNSDRAAMMLKVPIPMAAAVSSGGFHDCEYHSGEIYDNTDWSTNVGPGAAIWKAPASFELSPNTNALRWGMMYNYWFTANRPPVNGLATMSLFKPGTPESVEWMALVPEDTACPANCGPTDDLVVDVIDLLQLLADWGNPKGNSPCDLNGDTLVDVADLLDLLAAWGECP
jgi:hypothetical protein